MLRIFFGPKKKTNVTTDLLSSLSIDPQILWDSVGWMRLGPACADIHQTAFNIALSSAIHAEVRIVMLIFESNVFFNTTWAAPKTAVVVFNVL